MGKPNERLDAGSGGFTYHINEEDGDTLRGVYIYCPCGYNLDIEEMEGQDVIECPGCEARYTGTYKGWQIYRLREEGYETNADAKKHHPDS